VNEPAGGEDAVIARIAGDGSAVIWAAYIGGSEDESHQNSVRVDGAGNPYLLVTTLSEGLATPQAYQRRYGGGGDVLLTKLDPASGRTVWSTYLGGSGNESTETHELAVDAAGYAYIAAPTKSTNFPTTPKAFSREFDTTNNQTFVSKISPDGRQLVASTLLGGSGYDRPEGIAVDSSGNVVITGTTTSAGFPVTGDALSHRISGERDAYIVVLAPDLSSLVYSTLIGGPGREWGRGAAVLPDGRIAVGGETTGGGPWVSPNAAQPRFGGGTADGFVIGISIR
jgi:hypothetical protein